MRKILLFDIRPFAHLSVKLFSGQFIIILLLIFTFTKPVYSDGYIGYKGIYINSKGVKTWYLSHDVTWSYEGCGNYQFKTADAFNDHDFGSFTSTETLEIAGFAVIGWATEGDYVAGQLRYRVWRQGDTEPETWNYIDVGNYSNPTGGETQVVCSFNSDRVVGYDDGSTDINPGAPGTYNLKIQALGRVQYTGGGGGSFNDNDGPEVTATFIITSSTTDNFRSNAVIGNWTDQTSWESSSNSTNWAQATIAPSADAASITIRDGHNITLNANATVGSLTIASGGTFTSSDASARTLTIVKSSAGDEETFINNGTWANGIGGSTVVFTGEPNSGDARHQIRGSGTTSFQNVTVNKTGGDDNVGASFGNGSSVSGIFRIGNGGFLSTDPPENFYGDNATLDFNQGASATYEVNEDDRTWSTVRIPNNITVTTGTVQLNDSRSFSGLLQVESGAALTSNGNLTLLSSENNTATLLNYGTITGNVNIQRYIAAANWADGEDGWHMLSSPVTNSIEISGAWTPDGSSNNNYDFYAWFEKENTWVNRKNVGESAEGITFDDEEVNDGLDFVLGKGYMVSYEDLTENTFVGSPNSADVTNIPLTRTTGAYSKDEDAGFNLLGNPFPSPIKWHEGSGEVDWGLTNIATTAKIWNRTDKSYTDILAGEIIPSMNGFMVQLTDGTSGSITIPASARVSDVQNWFKSDQNNRLKLVAREADNRSAQESNIVINPESSTEYNKLHDSPFLPGYAPQFYSIKNENLMLSTNSQPSIDAEVTIPFGFVKNRAELFEIELLESISGQTVYLFDNKIAYEHNLSANPVYTFTASEGDEPNRFLIHFGALSLDDNRAVTAANAYVHGNTLYVLNAKGQTQLEVFDLQGRLLQSQSFKAEGLHSQPIKLPAGMYVVRIMDAEGVSSTKIIVK